eukprot:m.280629 g.280629  ORF g.280629 m.280629 type:complete len:65 (+) comp128017_c0_seq1:97-291(+)
MFSLIPTKLTSFVITALMKYHAWMAPPLFLLTGSQHKESKSAENTLSSPSDKDFDYKGRHPGVS